MSGLLAAFALVLAFAGSAKVRHPEPTVESLAALGLPARRLLARAVGTAECAVAVLAVTVGGRWPAALLAAALLALAVAAARLTAAAAGRDCGCFGAARSPVSHWHTAVDGAGAAVGLAGTLTGVPALREVVVADPGRAPALLTLVGVLAALLVLCLTTLPAMLRGPEAVR